MIIQFSCNYFAGFSMNILQMELGKVNPQEKPQDEDPQCPQTKFCLWEGEEFQELEVDFLNQVYPQKLSKNTMSKGTQFIFHFLSSSLYYWIQLRENPSLLQPQKLSIKDHKIIQQVLRQTGVDNDIAFNRWGQLFNKRDEFQIKFSQQSKFKVPQGKKIHQYERKGSKFQIIRYFGDNKELAQYKKRFQVIFLFYIDGVSYVWEEIDQWIYFIIYRIQDNNRHFVGVLSKFQFRISSLKERHRISQVLVLPNYQSQGHGKQLLDIVYKESLDLKECFQITTQAPSFQFQCLRDYKQSQMILNAKIFNLNLFEKVKNKDVLEKNRQLILNKQNIRQIKQKLKIPGHQIQRIVNILVYSYILDHDSEEARAIFEEELRQKIIFNRSAFKSRKKMPHITVFGQNHELNQFLLQKKKQQILRNTAEIQEILTETLDGFRRTISKLKKVKLIQ